MPASLPWLLMSRRFTPSLFAPAQLYKVHPEFFSDPADANGATLYHHLGIDMQREYLNPAGRPMRVLPSGTPIDELC